MLGLGLLLKGKGGREAQYHLLLLEIVIERTANDAPVVNECGNLVISVVGILGKDFVKIFETSTI